MSRASLGELQAYVRQLWWDPLGVSGVSHARAMAWVSRLLELALGWDTLLCGVGFPY